MHRSQMPNLMCSEKCKSTWIEHVNQDKNFLSLHCRIKLPLVSFRTIFTTRKKPHPSTTFLPLEL